MLDKPRCMSVHNFLFVSVVLVMKIPDCTAYSRRGLHQTIYSFLEGHFDRCSSWESNPGYLIKRLTKPSRHGDSASSGLFRVASQQATIHCKFVVLLLHYQLTIITFMFTSEDSTLGFCFTWMNLLQRTTTLTFLGETLFLVLANVQAFCLVWGCHPQLSLCPFRKRLIHSRCVTRPSNIMLRHRATTFPRWVTQSIVLVDFLLEFLINYSFSMKSVR